MSAVGSNMAKVEPLDPSVAKLEPVDGNLVVQVGTNEELNLVTAASILAPVLTTPVRNKVFVELCQSRTAPDAELRTTLAKEPVLETLSKIPSTLPVNFFPPRVSLLAPNTAVEPSTARSIVLKMLLLVPSFNSFPTIPALTETSDCPLSLESKIDTPEELAEMASAIAGCNGVVLT